MRRAHESAAFEGGRAGFQGTYTNLIEANGRSCAVFVYLCKTVLIPAVDTAAIGQCVAILTQINKRG